MNSIRTNPSHSEICFRSHLKNVLYIVWLKMLKNKSDLIEFICVQSEASIRMNPYQGFFRIKIGFDQSKLGFIRFENLFLIHLDWIGLSRIDFRPFFIKRDTKHFSDWFQMARKQISALIRSNWIPIRYFRQESYKK